MINTSPAPSFRGRGVNPCSRWRPGGPARWVLESVTSKPSCWNSAPAAAHLHVEGGRAGLLECIIRPVPKPNPRSKQQSVNFALSPRAPSADPTKKMRRAVLRPAIAWWWYGHRGRASYCALAASLSLHLAQERVGLLHQTLTSHRVDKNKARVL